MFKKHIHLSILIGALILSLCGNFVSAQENGKKAASDSKSAKNKTVELGNVDGVTADQLKDYLSFIASDEMEGRATPSQGLNITAKFIATNLSRWGFKPVGDNGTFLQKYKLKGNTTNTDNTKASISGVPLKFGDDFIPSARGGHGKVSGSIAYVGYGQIFKAKNIDPFKDIDIKDKTLLITLGLPPGISMSDYIGKYGVDYEFAETYGLKHGAKGIIYIPTKDMIKNWEYRILLSKQTSWDVNFRVSGPYEQGEKLPYIIVTPGIAERLLQSEKLDYKVIEAQIESGKIPESFSLSSDKIASFDIQVREESATTQNVVGILEGADPILKNEYIAIGAHYDHVGINDNYCTPVGNDNICNGADDDGSGTAAVLAIAEALSHGPKPKRSILFVWHSGEERGLWGSQFVVDNLPVPSSSIIAQFNIDMIGRSKKAGDTNPKNKDLTGPDETYVIGSKMMSTGLSELSEAVNKSYLNLAYNYKYDDPKDPERFFYRSDHYNYAKKGIPVIFFFSGVHEDYHQVTDSVDKIDFQKMEKITRTVMATVWKSANLAKRFVVDKPLPEQLQE